MLRQGAWVSSTTSSSPFQLDLRALLRVAAKHVVHGRMPTPVIDARVQLHQHRFPLYCFEEFSRRLRPWLWGVCHQCSWAFYLCAPGVGADGRVVAGKRVAVKAGPEPEQRKCRFSTTQGGTYRAGRVGGGWQLLMAVWCYQRGVTVRGTCSMGRCSTHIAPMLQGTQGCQASSPFPTFPCRTCMHDPRSQSSSVAARITFPRACSTC